MKVLNMNDCPVSFETDALCVVICLDSLQYEKSLRLFDIVYEWQDEFKKLNVPVYILTPTKTNGLSSTWFHFVYSPDTSFYEEYGLYRNKSVFGKICKIIYPNIFIFEQGKIRYIVKRITPKSVANAYLMVLKISYKKIVKKIEKKFDKV